MTYYVYSTLGQDNVYALYDTTGAAPVCSESVYIKGGTGVIGLNLITPQGVRTAITDQEYLALQKNHTFNRHVKNGFIVVEKSKEKIKTVFADMEPKDKSAQMTREDILARKDGAIPEKEGKTTEGYYAKKPS